MPTGARSSPGIASTAASFDVTRARRVDVTEFARARSAAVSAWRPSTDQPPRRHQEPPCPKSCASRAIGIEDGFIRSGHLADSHRVAGSRRGRTNRLGVCLPSAQEDHAAESAATRDRARRGGEPDRPWRRDRRQHHGPPPGGGPESARRASCDRLGPRRKPVRVGCGSFR